MNCHEKKNIMQLSKLNIIHYVTHIDTKKIL